MSGSDYGVFNAMTDIIASPGNAFDHIKDHTSWLWWALLVNLFLGMAVYGYFYSWVDFPWMVEETIRNVPPEDRAEAAETIRSFMKPETTMMITLVAMVVVTFVMYTVQAIYLTLVNKMTIGADIKFGQWFSLATWANFVGIFASLATLVVIMLADNNQLASTDLQPLSLNALLMHAKPGETWATWATSLSLISLWAIFLTAVGFRRWTGASTIKSWIVALVPWVLIFGIWALLNLR
jgi:hypothetical protein